MKIAANIFLLALWFLFTASLPGLPKLRELDLSRIGKLEDLTGLSRLPNLRKLHLN